MGWIDWTIVLVMVAGVIAVTCYGKRYMRSVSDFLAADRMAGRYLLTVSSGFYGAISLVAMWEMTYSTGLPPNWWANLYLPLSLFLALTGFISYRLRQTRVLTLAQFFEERYSRRFRYFAGLLCWLSGMLNYGIFPLITARLIVHFIGWPATVELGGMQVSSYALVMLVYLGLAVFVACAGGQITIMLTDFLQGSFLMLIFVVITIFLFGRFEWSDIMYGLQQGVPEGQSMINPFGGSTTEEFNIWFFIIGLLGGIYSFRSWQGNSAYSASAKTPHEGVMAGVIASWRMLASSTCLLLIPLIAYAVLHSETYQALAEPIRASINALGDDQQLKNQMTVPLFLRNILPVGLTGLFAAVIIGSAISCDDTYLHSWGTILIQDVVIPWRNKPFEPRQHLLILRLSVVGMALFGFLFSLFFPLKGYITMFQVLTAAIYTGGAGAVIIGGLYWRRGTTAAAWTAMILGTIFTFGGLLIQQSWPWWVRTIFDENHLMPWYLLLAVTGITCAVAAIAGVLWWRRSLRGAAVCLFVAVVLAAGLFSVIYAQDSVLRFLRGNETVLGFFAAHRDKFPITSQWLNFWAMLMASGSYVVISLFSREKEFNLDKMLHRKQYAVASDQVLGDAPEAFSKSRFSLPRLLGITGEFSRFERLVFYASFAWTMGWWAIFMIGNCVNIFWPIGNEVWSVYWWVVIWLSALVGIICTIWIFCGGIRDSLYLFRDLRCQRVDTTDDGFVRSDNQEN